MDTLFANWKSKEHYACKIKYLGGTCDKEKCIFMRMINKEVIINGRRI